MKTLKNYIAEKLVVIPSQVNEKLLINKQYKDAKPDVFIPDDIHITGEESRKNIIGTIEDCCGKQKHKLIYDMFSSLNYDSYEYAFFDINDDSDPCNKILDKIFPDGIEYYKDNYKDNADDYIPLNNNESEYLIKLNTINNDNKNTVIVWVSTDNGNTYIYIFWRAEI